MISKSDKLLLERNMNDFREVIETFIKDISDIAHLDSFEKLNVKIMFGNSLFIFESFLDEKRGVKK